jgi:hypothetical protein
MIRASTIITLAVTLLAGAVVVAHAQQFSADIVRTDPQSAAVAKAGTIRVADGKVRIETPDLPDGFFLINTERDTTVFVRPSARQYMEARQSSRLPQLFVPVDPNEPCDAWRKAVTRAGDVADWHCAALADAFAVSAPAHGAEKRWIDPTLRFPVKAEQADGSVLELQHVTRAAQPEGLFEIPAGYRRFDPEALIGRIKQSDVWVEPPK